MQRPHDMGGNPAGDIELSEHALAGLITRDSLVGVILPKSLAKFIACHPGRDLSPNLDLVWISQ
jgi:hypothetical protein